MRRYIVILLLIVLTVFLWPDSVHASAAGELVGTLFGGAGDIAAGLMEFMNAGLQFVQNLLTALLAQMGGLLQSVIELKLTYGGPTVYFVWKLFRDMCNTLFIVLFVLVAFGTIFNAVKKNSFMYSSALLNIIIAALLINFSLAIAQTVVWAGNEASTFVIKLFPNADIGAQVGTELKLAATVVAEVTPVVPPPPIGDIPAEKLTSIQETHVRQWIAFSQQGAVAPTAALTYLKKCLELSQLTAADCYKDAEAELNWANRQGDARDAAAQSRIVVSPTEFYNFYHSYFTTGTAKFAKLTHKNATSDISAQMGLFVNKLLSVVLLLTLVLSFLCVIIFMVVRLPAIWFLLATSAMAFFALAVPGNTKFKEWFNNLLGWCIFSPLYLFVIYIGLYFLSQQGSLMASLSNPQLPFFAGTFGSVLFFFIAGFIFLYGAKWATSTAFGFSKQAGMVFGKIGGALGVTEESMFGLKTVGRGIGVETRVEGARAGIASLYKEKVIDPLARRAEMTTARYQAKFGDRRALETLNQKRITEQFKKNEEAGFSMSDLKTDFKNKNGSPKYFASAKALLNAGELNPAQMNEYVAEATKLSPAYGRAVRESVEKNLKDRAKEKKFKNRGEVDSVLDMYSPQPGDSADVTAKKTEMRESVLKSLKKNQPLIAAELAGQGHYPGETPEQIVTANFSALESKDIRTLLDQARAGTFTRTPDIDLLIAGKSRKLASHLNIMADASPQQQAEIRAINLAAHITPKP